VCAEFVRSQLVIKATLIQSKALRGKDDPVGVNGYFYSMRVNQVIRGTAAGMVPVYEGNDSGRATFNWVPNRDYLLFLSYAADVKAWVLDGCGNSGPLSGAAPALSAINAIRTSGSGIIQGVVSNQAQSAPLAGVHVEAQSGQSRFVAVTNERGKFQFNVPPGRYSVRAVETGRTFEEADISYRDLDYPIGPGECAQVQLAQTSGRSQ
jgi:hypothetical protein